MSQLNYKTEDYRILSLVFCSNSYRHNFTHHEKLFRYCPKKLKKIYFINRYYLLNKLKIHASEYEYVKKIFQKIFLFLNLKLIKN